MAKAALVIGSRGQDGQLLGGYLSGKSYSVTGLHRQSPVSLLDFEEVRRLIRSVLPDEIYYLAAYHHSSEEAMPDHSLLWRKSREIHIDGLAHVLDAVVLEKPTARVFYASSSLIFSQGNEEGLSEDSPPDPSTAYGLSKLMGMQMIEYFRKHKGVFAGAGILFNHESEFRSEHFLSMKLVRAALKAQKGESPRIKIGDPTARVDWGYAGDYVKAMHLMLTADQPDDFVIATGQLRSVEDLAGTAFTKLGLDWRDFISVDTSLLSRRFLPRRGNPRKIAETLGWKPETGFEQMIEKMLSFHGGRIDPREK